ncbi:tripartite tricarboxylate transporter TctB family protein [Treponema sp. OMZ 840]|uniref:tripartite tricarboxylate transporter TctB family protein n=1 Tax=Treponema sp. OMZ 840 TaxID=244313 RepID=UPI003D8D5420
MAEKDKKNGSFVHKLIPLLCFILGLIILAFSLIKYGFWDNVIGPKSGFYPAIISVCLIGISIPAFFQSFKSTKAVMPKANWLVPLALLLIVISSYVIGMVPSLAVFLLLWFRKLEKLSWKTTLITSAVMTAIVVFVFQMWLQIEFPKGLLLPLLF